MQASTCAGCHYWKDGRGSKNYCRVVNQLLAGAAPSELSEGETGQLSLIEGAVMPRVTVCSRHTAPIPRQTVTKSAAPLPGQIALF